MDWMAFFRSNIEPMQAYQPGLREDQVWQLVETDTIYKLSSNESPLPPFPSAVAAMQQRLTALNEYPDGSANKLVQQLAWHYELPVDQIIVGNGSNELIDLIALTCLDPGDNIVYCWPSFIVYRSCAQLAKAEYRELPLRADGAYDLDALLAAIDERTKMVMVCTPNNPTGATVKRADFEAFLSKLPKHLLLVVDAAYEEFIDDEQAVRPLDYFDGQRPYVVLRTFSKMYALAGLRCGYGFAPTILIEALNKVREPFNVNTMAQVAATACLDDSEEVARRYAINIASRQELYKCFSDLGLRFLPSQANYVWVEVPDASVSFNALLKKGVIVRAFPGVNGLRVGVGDAEGAAATVAAFRQLFG